MFKVSKKTEYGILALQHMAAQQNQRISTVKEISESHRIPPALLAKILQTLARHRIIHSVQGAMGGYVLLKEPGAITFAEVLQAIEGPIRITDCYQDDHACERFDQCALKGSLSGVQKDLTNYFETVTLADLSPQTAE